MIGLTFTALTCWLLGWNTPEQLMNGAMWGPIFESFVFAEILKSYYNDGIVKPPLYYYRDADKNEIDLLIEEGDRLPLTDDVWTLPVWMV